ncbi:MAG: CotH kinase family protein [Bacteroidaceae bacterium]|nr:CotH kinase family protein [Bacteroidaceae bacterium]
MKFLACIFMAFCGVQFVSAQNIAEAAVSDTLFVYQPGGRLDVYPPAVVKSVVEDDKQLVVTTIDGQNRVYKQAVVDSVGHSAPRNMPVFTSFKFNNKFNGGLYTDVLCEIGANGLITGSASVIGKWLTPSFQLSASEAEVYIGRTRQRSKVSRLSFAEPVDYVVALPGCQILTLSKDTQEPVDPVDPVDPVVPDYSLDENAVKIALTSDMLSTNAPTMLENEGLPMLLDGNEYTFFHSTWRASGYETLPLDSCPWIEVNLPEAIHNLQFRYETREANQRWPLALRIDVSEDGGTWTAVKSFNSETDGIPQASLTWWTSPVIDLGNDYKYLRIVCTQAAYKNYLCMAELELYKVTGSSSEPTPVVVPTLGDGESLDWQPFGTKYTVSVDWPTDRAVAVPSIYITTDEGRLPYNKTTYLTGTFRIDGAGVFPDMEETPVNIKGRGNSSWAGENGKSPYRLKFDEKVKPFGMTKGKSWVLLANNIRNSMLTNAIGMKVAQMAGAAGANHIVPVELYINGEYRGSYNFTEKTGFSNNSIDLVDESRAALLELDTYTDETIYRSDFYYVPVKIHEPDLEDLFALTQLSSTDIMNDFNEMVYAASLGEDISRWVEVDTFAAFYLTNEFIMNLELMHPKSTFLYKEFVGDSDDLWKFGPIWDLDWSFGHELNGGYFSTGATSDYLTARNMECNSLWKALRKAGPTLDKAYYKAWTRLLRLGGVEELMDFCQQYYDYASTSFTHNATMWGDGYNYGSQVSQAQTWLQKRAEYIYNGLTPYDLSEELPEDEEWQPYGEVEVPDPIDTTPYDRVRDAIQNLLANADAYACNPNDKTHLDNTIAQQDNVVAKATSDLQVATSKDILKSAFVDFLSTDELEIKAPLELTDIFLDNPAPVEDTLGWYWSEMPHAFDSIHAVADFLDQPGAFLSQKVTLPAGTFQWYALALTRTGYKSAIFVDDETRQVRCATTRMANTLEEARTWFDQGNGVTTLTFTLTESAQKEMGLKADDTTGDHWTVWSNFRLFMTDKPVKPTVKEEQYKDALASVKDNTQYRILTHYNGSAFTTATYYLSRQGRLVGEKTDEDIFMFVQTEGKVGTGNTDFFASPGWQTDAYFTNPTLSNNSSGDIISRGSISVNTVSKRLNWEGQVWYKDGDRYAVRATNSPAGSWGAESYWTVEDVDSDGTPEAGYSWEPYFYWELEEVPYDGISDELGEEDLLAAPVFDLSGRRLASRLDIFLRAPHAPGFYVVRGRKIALK